MSIKSVNMQSSVNYSRQQIRSRTIEVTDNKTASNSNAVQPPGIAQQISAVIVEFSASALSSSQQLPEPVAERQQPPEEEFQQPQVPPKLLITKLLLEKMFGVVMTIGNIKLTPQSTDIEQPEADSDSSSQPITIDGQQFMPGDQLKITEFETTSQQLNYRVSGEFQINQKNYQVSYQQELSQQRTSISQRTQSAAQLKDPILVQYGDIGIGQLNGKSAKIDINGDNNIDELPMFSGDVGYLVFDKNGNGKADNGSELFGPQTGNGFNELSALDSNNNGFVDRDDESFSQLYLWQVDSSGNSNWTALSDTSIEGISLNVSATPFNFFDKSDQLRAQLTQSGIALTDQGRAYGVHQVDVRI